MNEDGNRGFMETSAHGVSERPIVAAGETIGNWRIIENLGAGGMSSVYTVERADGLFSQRAALKLMAPGGPNRKDRFDRERQALALLDHPSIARIIDGGSDDKDRPYLVMELVEGVTIGDWAKAKKPSSKTAVQLLCDLCVALDHAHARMILHRDIKPANLLIDEEGRFRLVDFGVSASLELGDVADTQLPAHTPAFAAPEQLTGEAETSATDIFAVGCIGSFLLTGAVPKRAEDGSILLDDTAIDDRDLIAILKRATLCAPEQRYQTANTLREDLQAWLDVRPVDARGGGAGYRLQRFVQRNPLASVLGSVSLISLIGGLIVSLVMADRAREERDLAELARAEAEWSLDRSNYFNQSTSAYADLMQRMFGESDDVERLTGLLLDRVKEVQDSADEDPQSAAFLSFAVGRHFLFRNDYTNSLAVLEPWINGGYGPEKFQLHGKQLLAIAYRRTGNRDGAIELERQIERQMSGTFDENTPDHAVTASNLALITLDPDDVRRAKEVVAATIPLNDDPSITMYLNNQLSRLHVIDGDFAKGYAAMQQVVQIIEDDAMGEISGQDTGRLNLVIYELFYSEDLDRAQELLESVFEDAEVRGESSELARAYWYRGEIEARRGDLRGALANLEKAIPLAIRFTGEDAPVTKDIRYAGAELLARSGDHDAAAAMLEAAGDETSARYRLAKLRLVLEKEGAQAALNAVPSAGGSLASELTSVESVWRYEKLREDGLRLPALSDDQT